MKISFKRPISVSLSPNTEKDDAFLALKLIFQPRKWKNGQEEIILKNKIKNYFHLSSCFLFNSGRSSLLAILKSLDLDKKDEILIQAFTCNAAVNPIIKAGLRPVFVDIDEHLNMNPIDLEKKITHKSKVVIIQHTFGWPAQIDKIKGICQRYNLFLIEDCAHSLGTKYKNKLCGTFGEAAFLSFGRDKIISSVYGGAVITNNKQLSRRIEKYYNKINFPSNFWIFQQLLHPVLFNYLILPLYNIFKLGRVILALAINAHLLSKSVTSGEMQAKMPNYFPKKLPNALSSLALHQFLKLDRLNQHRQNIAKIYQKKLINSPYKPVFTGEKSEISPIFMRYPILVDNPSKVLEEAKRKGIILYDGWSGSPIVPPKTNLNKFYYQKGSCPQAESICLHILNLPTNINIKKKQAEDIINLLTNIYYEGKGNKK